jgi:glutathione S-transferase
MKLYYAPGACSMASHISLLATGLKFEIDQVDMTTKKTKSGKDFMKINSKGYVPCIETDKGEVLTEGCAILQYIADQAPEKNLIPKNGTWERYRAQEWLNFIATELHKGYSPLFKKGYPEAARAMVIETLNKRFEWLSQQVKPGKFLLGSHFTVCDAYLHTVLSWSKHVNVDLSKWPVLLGYAERVSTLPQVQAAVKAEGIK